jgi:hypothetical protein
MSLHVGGIRDKLKFDTLVKMGCWEMCDIPLDAPLLGVRWVCKIKRIQSV